MKGSLIIAFSLLCFFRSFCQMPLDSQTGLYTYSEVVTADSVGTEQLYSRAKVAITKLFNSGKDVTQVTDDNNFQIIGKGFTTVIAKAFMASVPLDIWFTLTIQCRDGRYKYIVSNFEQKGNSYASYTYGALEQDKPRGMPEKTWQQVKKETDDKMKDMVFELKKIMSSSSNSNSDNW